MKWSTAALCLFHLFALMSRTQQMDAVMSNGPRPFNKGEHHQEKSSIDSSLIGFPGNAEMEGNSSEADRENQQSLSIDSSGFPNVEEISHETSLFGNPSFHPKNTSIVQQIDTDTSDTFIQNNDEYIGSEEHTLARNIGKLQRVDDNPSSKKSQKLTESTNSNPIPSLSGQRDISPVAANLGKLGNEENNSETNTNKSKFSLLRLQPTGSLYVDNAPVRDATGRLQVGSSTTCTMPELEDKDEHSLSNSQYGYPKSIVSRALAGSHAELMLKVLEDQLKTFNPRKETTASGDTIVTTDNLPKSAFIGQVTDKLAFNKGQSGAPPLRQFFGDIRFGKETDLFKGRAFSPSFSEMSKTKTSLGQINKEKRVPDFPFALNGIDTTESSHLLEGSAFQKQPEQVITSQKPTEDSTRETFGNGRDALLQPETNQYQLSDVRTNDESWLSSSSENIYPAGFSSYDTQRPSTYASGIESMFPPKSRTGLFGSSSTINDFGAKPGDNFIKYSPDKTSSVSSPFQLDTKSLFSSISGVSLGEGSSQPNTQLSNVDVAGFQSKPPMFSSGYPTPFHTESNDKFSKGFQNGNFEIPRHIRKKRQASRETTTLSATTSENACPTSYKLLRQYKNHGGSCFIVQPEIQAILYTSCTNSRCRGCRVGEGDSRCQAVRVPMWVWSYCEDGPRAGMVTADRISVSVACTCKVTLCRRQGR